MLSTIPAFSFSEPGLVNQFSDFQTGFTPWGWDYSELFSANQLSLEPALPSPCYGETDTGFVRTNPGFVDIKTGSDESYAGFTKTKPGSDETDRPYGLPSSQANEPDSDGSKQNHDRTRLNEPEITDDRKRKRMESNRESARRSRMRKQTHIDNLRNQVNRLDLENRELQNRLRLVIYQFQRMSTDNNRLMTEQEILRLKLSEMRRILIIRQLQQQQQRRMITTEQNIF